MGIEQGRDRPETVSEIFAAFVEASSWSDIELSSYDVVLVVKRYTT